MVVVEGFDLLPGFFSTLCDFLHDVFGRRNGDLGNSAVDAHNTIFSHRCA